MARIADRVRGAGMAARDKIQSHGNTIRGRVTDVYSSVRKRWRWFDHLALAYDRYQEKRGGSLAGATTFFAFLSFFPLVALAFSVAGYAAAINPHAADWLRTAIQSVLPGLASQLPLDSIAKARANAGIAGLVGLLIAGLGGVSSVRQGPHVIMGPMGPAESAESPPKDGNVLVQKAWDTAVLVALGLCLILSAVATTLAVPAARGVLGWGGAG